MTWQMEDSLIYVYRMTRPSLGVCGLLVKVNARSAVNTDIKITFKKGLISCIYPFEFGAPTRLSEKECGDGIK